MYKRLRCSHCVIALVLVLGAAHAAAPTASAPTQGGSAPVAATAPQRSIVEQMKRSVVFLTTTCPKLDEHGNVVLGPDGKPIPVPYYGTGFLIGMPDQRLGNRSFTYLVTNRHMAQPGIEDSKPCAVMSYEIRLDRKLPDSNGFYSTGGTFQPVWRYSTDAADDLAIAPIGIDDNVFDIVFLPTTLLLGKSDIEANKVEEGYSVLFTGLFIQYIQKFHSEPIIREGKIAMFPREKVQTTLKVPGDIFLVDCHVFGGNSGSPMFVNLRGDKVDGINFGYDYKILGVVSGEVFETASMELHTVASYGGTVVANSGVATVVPAQKILDILDLPELKALREAVVATLPKKP